MCFSSPQQTSVYHNGDHLQCQHALVASSTDLCWRHVALDVEKMMYKASPKHVQFELISLRQLPGSHTPNDIQHLLVDCRVAVSAQ